MMKKHALLIKVSAVILVILVGLVLYLFAFQLKKSSSLSNNLFAFDYTYDDEDSGFVDANALSNDNKLVATKGNYELYLDQTTSHFNVKNISTGAVIKSNPGIEDPKGPPNNIKNRQKSTIEYRYFNKNGSISLGENYSRSIAHPKNPEFGEGYRTFKLKEVENGFQVFYQIKDVSIDYLYFPLYLEPELFEPILEDRTNPARRHLVNAYWDTIDKETGKYKARKYEDMSGAVIDLLYQIFYVDEVFGEYSRERSINENALNGYFDIQVKFGFDIAIQVLLEDEGVEVKVISNSIKEYSESKLADITLYPYFGAVIDYDIDTKEENKGYLVIPDGSGAILEFNNGKTSARSYSKRLYGGDLAVLPYEMPEEQEKILIPVYGSVSENIGFAAIITEGDALATLNANVSGIDNNSYNRIYTNFKIREYEFSVIGSGWNTYRINIWTKDRVNTDFTIKYKILIGNENNYTGIAKAYQNYLIAEKGLKVSNEVNNKVIIELLGAFNKKEFFLGIPYEPTRSLTTYKQATEIIDELNELGVDNLDIIFNGIINGGLDNGFETKVKFERKVGSKRKYEKFVNKLSAKNIEVYPTANFFSSSEFNRPLDSNRYSSKRIKGSTSILFEYNIPTRLPYSEIELSSRKDSLVINPQYYEAIYKKFNKNYSFDNLLVENIGSNLAGNYKKKNVVYLNESLFYQENLLKKIAYNQTISISEPLGFSFPYLSLATDLPLESTLYTILDYRIPLVQLVLSGVVNYTHDSINLSSERDIDYKFLKALENGAGLKYTLSYESSLMLLETGHNEYLSTKYTNWLETIQKQYQVLKANDLVNARIVSHERIASNVFKTTYSNNVEVITNYNLTSVTVEGVLIGGINYFIKGGD